MTVKPRTNLLLDGVIFVLFVVVLASGLLLWQVYPGGGGSAGGGQGGRGHGGGSAQTVDSDASAPASSTAAASATAAESTVLGLSKHTMRTVHDWAGILMGALVGVHLLFHWRWIVCQARRLFGRGQPVRRGRTCAERA